MSQMSFSSQFSIAKQLEMDIRRQLEKVEASGESATASEIADCSSKIDSLMRQARELSGLVEAESAGRRESSREYFSCFSFPRFRL